MSGREIGTLSDSLSEIQWEWLHWELDQALISGCKIMNKKTLVPGCVQATKQHTNKDYFCNIS